MDWLRRNWPDLLIGVALVAVIAGIIATLISGGSFFPVGQGERAGSTPTQTGPSTPGATSVSPPGSSAPSSATGSDSTTSPEVPTASLDAPTAELGSQDPASSASRPSDTASRDGDRAPAADEPVTAATPDSSVSVLSPSDDTPSDSPSSDGAAVALPIGDPAPSSAAAAPSSTAPQAAAATPPAVERSATIDEASFRVALGAFGNADNAQRLAQTFQSAGYPVLLGTQGNLTIVLAGPYESESEARRVADAVRQGDFGVADPVVHRYEPEPGSSAESAGVPLTATPAASPTSAASSTSSSTSASTTTAPATAAPSATASSGRYLQVGAYANRESSLPQRERMEGLGFTVIEDTEGSLLKLLVGPFQGSALSDAQSKLAAEGIENFAR